LSSGERFHRTTGIERRPADTVSTWSADWLTNLIWING
jgi:hypothetical protein